jgi:hypothetical protein
MDAGLTAIGIALLFGGKGRGTRESAAASDIDGARLHGRAYQADANAWSNVWQTLGTPAGLADGYARWAGIESSGNPMALSPLGERGLFQIGRAEALKDHAVTGVQWDAMRRASTTRQMHAKIAADYAAWAFDRARRLIKDPPSDYISALWYAKMYHQRPVDVRDAHLHGPALQMARELAARWAGSPAKMHRLRAANVVAFGRANP